MTQPMPAPRTTMCTEETTTGVDGVRSQNRKSPAGIAAVPTTGKILYLPHLVTGRPLMVNVTSIPQTSGSTCIPGLVGVAAWTVWR